ncbi:hypothetical protein ACMA1I_00585 [Pontibacter sp. 13R65]|uniref:hypothetical protein n=1 Tax=Pontibacter sp. 13R65 TaxID=3127458 RepID=UPI00301C39DB
MKKVTTLGLMLCLGVFLSFGATAQQRDRAQGQRQGQTTGQDRSAQMLKQYKEQLNLSNEQETKIEAILSNALEQQQALRQSANREEAMTKRRAIMEKTQTDIRAILTADQAKQFDVLVAERQQRMQNNPGQRQRSN